MKTEAWVPTGGQDDGKPEAVVLLAMAQNSRLRLYCLFRPGSGLKRLVLPVVFRLFTRMRCLQPSRFFVFCLISSAGYVYNDIADREEDALHPTKCHRPVAAGKVSVTEARVLVVLLVLLAAGGGFPLSTAFGLLVLAYFLLTVAYSLWLKQLVLIDLLVLAAGFVLRAAAGAVAVGVTISPWLLICTTLLSLFLGLGKRRQ